MFGMEEITKHFKAEAAKIDKARAKENADQLIELKGIRAALEAIVARIHWEDDVKGTGPRLVKP